MAKDSEFLEVRLAAAGQAFDCMKKKKKGQVSEFLEVRLWMLFLVLF